MAKKVITGIIVSDKMTNTVVVEITRHVSHPKYLKRIKVTKKIKADTNGMKVVPGDTVRIEETRPMSKDKHFKVVEKVELTNTKEGEKKSGK